MAIRFRRKRALPLLPGEQILASQKSFRAISQRMRYDHGECDPTLWTLLLVVFGPGGALGAKLHPLLVPLGYSGSAAGIQKVTAVALNLILGTGIGWAVGRTQPST